ncbi:hypothetical protein [Sphingomonas sp. TZW2008]|uniref:hypothetical protein n=1 Tax=Sphingomonas sp. TZW2008 TaxID=1917973 RepID=UPI0011819F7C|nr:hypothetical protein [Sphingomonas sp. TZW2008]
MLLIVAAFQAAMTLPDVELRAQVRAKSVLVEQRGTSRLSVRAEPDGGSVVRVQAPPAQRTLNNVTVTVDAAARVAPDAANTAAQ